MWRNEEGAQSERGKKRERKGKARRRFASLMLPRHGHTGSINWPPYWGVLRCCGVGKLPAGPVRCYSVQLIALAPFLPSVSSPSLVCSFLLLLFWPFANPSYLLFIPHKNLHSQFLFFSHHLLLSQHSPLPAYRFCPAFLSLPCNFLALMAHAHFYLTRSVSLSTSHLCRAPITGHPRVKSHAITQSFSAPPKTS